MKDFVLLVEQGTMLFGSYVRGIGPLRVSLYSSNSILVNSTGQRPVKQFVHYGYIKLTREVL